MFFYICVIEMHAMEIRLKVAELARQSNPLEASIGLMGNHQTLEQTLQHLSVRGEGPIPLAR